MEKNLYIISGCNGAGKTTANILASKSPVVEKVLKPLFAKNHYL